MDDVGGPERRLLPPRVNRAHEEVLGRATQMLDAAWFSGPSRLARATIGDFLASLLPTRCAGCQEPGGALCPECEAAVRSELLNPQIVDDFASLDVLAPRFWAPIVSAGRYSGGLAAAILEAKRPHGVPLLRVLAPGLGRALRVLGSELDGVKPAGRWAGLEASEVALVPVPPAPGSLRRRGFSPVLELLDGARPLRWQTRPLLRRRGKVQRGLGAVARGRGLADAWSTGRGSGGQKGRGRGGRRAAVKDSFVVGRGCRGLRGVILVDDVSTSGATLAECARVIRSAGLMVMGAVVLAHVPSPQGDSAGS